MNKKLTPDERQAYIKKLQRISTLQVEIQWDIDMDCEYGNYEFAKKLRKMKEDLRILEEHIVKRLGGWGKMSQAETEQAQWNKPSVDHNYNYEYCDLMRYKRDNNL